MIDIKKLTNNEIMYIIQHIKPEEFRKYFQKNPEEFSEIKSGFRAEKLSDNSILSIVKNNINNRFIYSYIGAVIDGWLEEIRVNISMMNKEGYTKGEALIKAIPNSLFHSYPELYFKLNNCNKNNEYIDIFKNAISLSKKISDKKDEEEKKIIEDNSLLIDKLNNKIDNLQDKIIGQEKIIKALQDDNHSYKNECLSKNNEISNIGKELSKIKKDNDNLRSSLEHYNDLKDYIDDEFDSSKYHRYSHMSIGQINYNSIGQARINRLADIENGKIHIFKVDDSKPSIFDNRDKLYYKGNQMEDGKIGIWNWDAVPNDNDPTRDFIISEYNQDACFIEVINFAECSSLSDIVWHLKNGIDENITGRKVLFTYGDKDERDGLLCSAINLKHDGNKIELSDEVFILPEYKINVSKIISLAGINIFYSMKMGIPKSLYRVQSPYKILKNIILHRASNTALREQGWSNKEAQKYREYLRSIPYDSIEKELQDKYRCSDEDAKVYIEQFRRNINDYLTSTDIGIKILSIALENNPALVERCKKELSQKWEEENSEKITLANNNLETIEKTVSEKENEINKILKYKYELTNKIKNIQDEIDRKEELAKDVEVNIASRIEEAKNNAADFISKMAFIFPASRNITSLPKKRNTISIYESAIEMEAGGDIDDIDEFIDDLVENFMVIGYDGNSSTEMSRIITFSICHSIPVILGSNSSIIGQCLAATINGGNLSELFISNQGIDIDDLINTIEDILSDESKKVILIHGIFDGYSSNIYNALSARLISKKYNCIFLFSSIGIPVNMLPTSIWENSFYLDGDKGLKNIITDKVNSFDINILFTQNADNDSFIRKRKKLVDFELVMSNTQLKLYALYLSNYKLDLNDSHEIIEQMIIMAKVFHKEKLLQSAFNDNGISYGIELLEKSF